jgi:hypothetical protein
MCPFATRSLVSFGSESAFHCDILSVVLKNISSIYDTYQKTMVEGGWYLLQAEYSSKKDSL